ncbi:MAG: tRNA (adenosine(37)-N6)-threonylcarbamoyltransferase complex transferase subunit TsaD [Bacteroidetes bacterium]|nr:tRNA (adenosine(37)-N6)-threonylcarbamoyltransferase complex transferase subunit TsaD [Bacteroidota bacterium]
MQYSTILGIESSCDDTAAAVWQNGKILANIGASQEIHAKYGGVVPELASRAHQSHIIPVVHEALSAAGITAGQLDAIAFTQGPGLMGSLLVGIHVAKGMAMALGKPLIGVNHLQAHVSALYIGQPQPPFPLLVLLVSGGHTQLIRAEHHLNTQIAGSTIDDAAGEAFDKAAKLLGLNYPGGPEVDRYARMGNPHRFTFPESRVPGLDMSFSGLKTSLLYFLRRQTAENPEFIAQNLADICASYQHSIVEYLMHKLELAIAAEKPACLGLAGGVSANSLLRTRFAETGAKYGLPVLIPAFEYCTDNAAMIAAAGHYLLESGQKTPLNALPFTRNR